MRRSQQARHDLMEYLFIDRKRHASIAAGALYNSAPPPPLTPPANIPQSGDALNLGA